jgi:hypothetical protein
MLPVPYNTTKNFLKLPAYSNVKRIPPERSTGNTVNRQVYKRSADNQNDNSPLRIGKWVNSRAITYQGRPLCGVRHLKACCLTVLFKWRTEKWTERRVIFRLCIPIVYAITVPSAMLLALGFLCMYEYVCVFIQYNVKILKVSHGS